VCVSPKQQQVHSSITTQPSPLRGDEESNWEMESLIGVEKLTHAELSPTWSLCAAYEIYIENMQGSFLEEETEGDTPSFSWDVRHAYILPVIGE